MNHHLFTAHPITYEADGFSFIDPSEEETKNVEPDGKDYPNVGLNLAAGFASSARRVNQRTLEVTDKMNGKITGTEQIKLSSDLKTLTITVHATGRSEPNGLVFERASCMLGRSGFGRARVGVHPELCQHQERGNRRDHV